MFILHGNYDIIFRVREYFVHFVVCISVALAACDLQPKITALPDTVGGFIESRYPALLADPDAQPEIYNSAASDYGVYASPELYGTYSTTDDYVLYASVDDYILPPPITSAPANYTPDDVANDDVVPLSPAPENAPVDDWLQIPMYGGMVEQYDTTQYTVVTGDTLYAIANRYKTSVDKIASNNNLVAPYQLHIGQKLKIPTVNQVATVQTVSVPAAAMTPVASTTTIKHQDVSKTAAPETKRVDLVDITVGAGDTLYSISRRYSVPVNDLAVMNNLSAPFNLSAGQKLRVPDSPAVRRAANAPMTPIPTSTPPHQPATTTTGKSNTPTTPDIKQKSNVADNTQKSAPSTTTKQQTVSPTKEKISSDPTKKLPKIAARSSSKFSWPVRGKILSDFGAKSNGLFNDGINIAASRGTSVGAAENGVVAYAGNEVKGMGNLVIIQHSDGWMTVYGHMDSMSVRRGTRVSVGQKIGTVGQTGKVSSPQLHFEIRKGTKAYNPTSYMKSK